MQWTWGLENGLRIRTLFLQKFPAYNHGLHKRLPYRPISLFINPGQAVHGSPFSTAFAFSCCRTGADSVLINLSRNEPVWRGIRSLAFCQWWGSGGGGGGCDGWNGCYRPLKWAITQPVQWITSPERKWLSVHLARQGRLSAQLSGKERLYEVQILEYFVFREI